MALSLLTALVALGLLHVLPQVAGWRNFSWFRPWVGQLGDTSGAGRVALVLLLPALACLLVVWVLGHLPAADLWRTLFALAVLLYCFGPRDFDTDVEAVLSAPDDVSRENAAQALSDQGDPIAWTAPAMSAAVAYAALRRRFAVLFWFFVLGPFGALLYCLAQLLGRDDRLALDDDTRTASRYFANALDWLPAHLLVFTLAIVGHWEAVIGSWRRSQTQTSSNSWYVSGPDFLGAAAQADIVTEIEAGDGYAEERSDPIVELSRLRSALLRALLAWLSVVALIVIGSWLG